MALATKEVTRRELLERWSVIEQQEEEDASPSLHHPVRRRRIPQLKEQWFSDAFNFLIYLPKESHIWCGYWDLMGPLLETFYNYFKDQTQDSPLKMLWNRITGEMKRCTLCIHQHHQAKEMYATDYEQICIRPLLDVLCILDEQRISQHLKDLNARIARGEYDMERDYQEVVCVMFEVLMFPILLDDLSLDLEFERFIEAVDNTHELTLDENQQYPGVYYLLFSKSRRVRSIGHRLAGRMGKLRRSGDLDPLQYLLKKCIYVLETELGDSVTETSRPRVQLDRTTVWLGMKSLVGFLEPQAFEEGILDRYPVFLSIVLNNISDDSIEFSNAVNCLRLLFEKLGCKLWLRATLSSSVMRNSLLGQCFHTRNEKNHKEIFDLFHPFLQSLEALQDGEHEKQRRHFLYFLLHQVPVSSNFSKLMRKKACQIALLIVLRGYRIDPPCPPYECAHMWGPSLVSSLRDASLHISLRQPAIDLVQTIVVSDASALISVILKEQLHPSDKPIMPNNLGVMEDEGETLSGFCIQENGTTCWEEFSLQQKIISQVDGSWMCVPMLWYDVLFEMDPLILPLSFSKAVFWALSRFSVVETGINMEMPFSVRNWLASCASEVTSYLGWKVPTSSDDGGDGTESKNSIRISTMCLPLVRTFKRLTAHYTFRMAQGELRKQWTWEPTMSNSLILFLVDPVDDTRQVGRLLLEHVSNTRGLTCGLQFLCSTPSSLLAVLQGLRDAMKLVQLHYVLQNFQTLHHLFFVLCKLLKEGYFSAQTVSQDPSDVSDIAKYSSQGGFLKQPMFDSSPSYGDRSSCVSSATWKKFSCLLSQFAWASIPKCLEGGKTFADDTVSQMACIRLLEVMPVVFERLPQNSASMVEKFKSLKWLYDLADWGKSSIAVVVRYWKRALGCLLSQIKSLCTNSASEINDIEKVISCEKVSVDEVTKHIARLAVSLTDEGYGLKISGIQSKCSPSEVSLNRRSQSVESEMSQFNKSRANALDSKPLIDLEGDNVILISDSETEAEVSVPERLDDCLSSQRTAGEYFPGTRSGLSRKVKEDPERNYFSIHSGVLGSSEASHRPGSGSIYHVEEKTISGDHGQTKSDQSSLQPEVSENKRKETENRVGSEGYCLSNGSMNMTRIANRSTISKHVDTVSSQMHLRDKAPSNMTSTSSFQQNVIKHLKPNDAAVKEIVRDNDDDAWNFSFFKPPKQLQPLSTMPRTCGPKRQVIKLSLPLEKRPGSMRLAGGGKRFQPPRLDDWYRPILELDFFVAVGLASQTEKDHENLSRVKEVPVCFQSPDGYIEIFKPLVLEEFKSQLESSYQEMASTEEMCCGSLSVLSVERIDDFHIVRFVHDENEFAGSKSLSENDLVLLTRKPLKNCVSDIHTIGKVEKREKDSKRRLNMLAVRLYLQGCSRLNQARKFLTERTKWYASRIMSITPQLREFQALSSIGDIPLLPIILNPFNHHGGQYESKNNYISKLSEPLQQVLKSSYNGSQLQAISVAVGPFDLKDFELTLIQGPPGTGKTRTIVGIVSGLLACFQLKDSRRSRSGGGMSSDSSRIKPRISESVAIARAWQDAALAKHLNDVAKYNSESTEGCTRGRILICAQSNAAVDELVARICSEGLYGCNGESYRPYLVRVGNPKTVHPNSMPYFLDTLVEDRLAKEKKDTHDKKYTESFLDSLNSTRANLEKLVDQIRYYEAMRASSGIGDSEPKNLEAVDCGETNLLSDTEMKVRLRQLYAKKKAIYAELAHVQARERKASEEIKGLRQKFRTTILKEAEIVVTTLSGSGGDLYGVCSEWASSHKFSNESGSTLFDAVVIDEAAQALEPATLIPLQLLKSKGTKCIMVGDPKQLPATVLSSVASKCLFQCSMFERLQKAGHPVIMLTQQYRMHPDICRFPSLHFYEGKLLNGDDMSDKSVSFHETSCLGPYVLFDIMDGQELRGKSAASLSLCNESEVDAAVELLRFFKRSYPSEFLDRRIGLITPYKRQLSLLQSRFSVAFGSSTTAKMEFNTVDGFQGREVDILILSTVRAAGSCSERPGDSSSNLGFVADVRRMNVALTRAKLSLWIFGNIRTLQTNRSWAALIEDAKKRNLIIQGRKPYTSMFKFALENRVKPVSECANSRKKVAKHTSQRKIECTGLERSPCISEDVSPSTKAAARDDKHGARTGKRFLPGKNAACRSSDKQMDVGKSDVGEGNDNDHLTSHSANGEKAISRTLKQPVGDETRLKTIKKNKLPEVKVGTSSSERGKRESDKHIAISKVPAQSDLIRERKQQREAVDALLSSALIPSRKSSSSAESLAKRTPSSTNTGDQKRARKGKNG